MVAKEKYDWDQVLYDVWFCIDNKTRTGKEFTLASVAREIGVNRSSIRRICEKRFGENDSKQIVENLGMWLEVKQSEEVEEAALIFVDKKMKDDPDWREWAKLAEETQEFGQRIEGSQRTAKIQIKTDCPISLMFSGDWHLGSEGVAYDQWVDDIEYLLSTPNLYMAEVGDDRQNMRNFRNLSAVLNQVLSPKQQAHMLRGVIEELTANDKLVAKVGGNHDEEFDQRIFGEALQGYLLEKMKAPRFKNRGLVYLTVGEVEYTILLFHKSRFKSFLRRAHGAMREHQLSFPANIVAGGHDHTPGMEHLHHYSLAEKAGEKFGGETLLIKVGTYQDSEHGWRYFSNGGLVTNYTVVLYPYEKKMTAFTNPKDAIRFVNSF